MKQILTLLFLLVSGLAFPGEIIVSEGESLHEALRQAREWRRTNDVRCQGGITIKLKAARYYMEEPLFLRPEDSGTEGSPTSIIGEPGTVICGDPYQEHTQVWPKEGMERMLGFDKGNRTITIPTPPQQVLDTKKLEMVVHQRWAIAILRVKDMKVQGDKTIVTFMEPESRLEFEHPWPQPVIGGERGNSSFLLRTTEQRDGIEQLVIIDGAKHVSVEGITFEHTSWNRPLHKGHVTLQGGFPLIDAYKIAIPGLPWDENLENQAWIERPVSAVNVRHAEDVHFIACTFRNLGATALDIESIQGGSVKHCTFDNIGGTAIMAGSFAESPREVHRPYTDLASLCRDLTIDSNTITRASQEDWGAVAIGCGYVRDCRITGNTITHVNYSGICVGWGWTPHDTGMKNNHIINNKVSDYAHQLYDAGGIYTLSNQPGSFITNNEISPPTPAPYATNDRAFRIYLDARTDGFTITGNTTEGRPIHRDEIGDNHPGSNINIHQTMTDAIADRQWRIDISMMNTMRYGARPVTSDFYLELRGDTLRSYLPYLGRAWVASTLSPSIGLNFEEPVLHYKESIPKSKKYTQIDIDVRTIEDSYHYMIELYDSGETMIRVRSLNRDPISFDGTMTNNYRKKE